MSPIDDKRNELPFLGNPVDEGTGSAEMDDGDGRGRSRDYQNGSIFWTPQTGAHEVHGAIRVKWAQLGGTRGFLGYPTTDESGGSIPGSRFNHFEGGSIYWTPQGGPHEVHGAIHARYQAMGFERSQLELPVSDELAMPGGRLSRFQGGEITWTPAGGPQVRLAVPFDDQ
jgi:uncharacterized protein with LGFP repeats